MICPEAVIYCPNQFNVGEIEEFLIEKKINVCCLSALPSNSSRSYHAVKFLIIVLDQKSDNLESEPENRIFDYLCGKIEKMRQLFPQAKIFLIDTISVEFRNVSEEFYHSENNEKMLKRLRCLEKNQEVIKRLRRFLFECPCFVPEEFGLTSDPIKKKEIARRICEIIVSFKG